MVLHLSCEKSGNSDNCPQEERAAAQAEAQAREEEEIRALRKQQQFKVSIQAPRAPGIAPQDLRAWHRLLVALSLKVEDK